MSTEPNELGPYRIVRPVGRGGMGIVYEAVHTGLDKRVALKVLPRGLRGDRLERFLREARTAAALHHTNIVPVFDVGEVHGVPYYAMQFIDGQTLDAFLRPPAATQPPHTLPPEQRGETASLQLPPPTKSYVSPVEVPRKIDSPEIEPAPGTPTRTVSFVEAVSEHPSVRPATVTGSYQDVQDSAAEPIASAHQHPALEPRRAVEVVLQAAEGLAYAHARGVVHRDIKPSNLILDLAGVVWVADFGLAIRADDPSLTADGAVLGTPRYMSPEQALAQKTDSRTDVYSLGVSLYELLTGIAAFPGDTPLEVIQKVLTLTPPRPRSWNRKIPRDLETVVLKAMAKRPEDRYPSGREFADDLRRFLVGEPVNARRITPVGKAWRWSKRNPAVASLLAAVLLIFSLGATVSAYYADQAEKREREARVNESAAIQKESEATEQKNKALDAEKRNRRLVYAAKMTLAGSAFQRRNFERVTELLRETLPESDQEDLRSWEWHALFRYVCTDVKTSIVEKSNEYIESKASPINTHGFLVRRKEEMNDKLEIYDSKNNRVRCVLSGKYPGLKEDAKDLWILFSPDGDFVAGWDDGHLHVWNSKSGIKIYETSIYAGSSTGNITMGPSGLLIYSTEFGKYSVGRLGAAAQVSGKENSTTNEFTLIGPRNLDLFPPHFMTFSSDGRKLAVLTAVTNNEFAMGDSSFPEEALVFNLTDSTPLPQFRVGFEAINGYYSRLSFRSDDQGILVGGTRKDDRDEWREFVHEFNFQGNRDRHQLAEGSPPRELLELRQVSPCGRWLARTGRPRKETATRSLEIWNLEKRSRMMFLPDIAGSQPISIDWSPDGNRLLLAVDEAESLRSTTGFTQIAGLTGFAVLAPNFRHPPTLRLLEIQLNRTIEIPSPVVMGIQISHSPCGKWILVSGQQGWAVLDATTLSLQMHKQRQRVEDIPVPSLYMTRNAELVCLEGSLAGNEGNNPVHQFDISIWDISRSRQTAGATVSKLVNGLCYAAFDPNGKWIAVNRDPADNKNRELAIFDLSNLQAAPRIIPSVSGTAVVDPQGRYLTATVGRDIHIYRTVDWQLHHKLPTLSSDQMVLLSLTEHRILGYSDDNGRQTIAVWEPETGQQLLEFQCHSTFCSLEGEILEFMTSDGSDPEIPFLDGTPVPLTAARLRLGVK